MDYFHILLTGFGLFWLLLALRPHDRRVWLAEHVLTVISIAAMLAVHRYWPLTDFSYSLIFAFLFLHSIGAYFTYVRVPYDATARWLVGREISRSFGWVRNHYDRLVHFAYGLLLAYPLFELTERYAQPATGWSYFIAISLIMASSMLFEVFEWWASALLSKGEGAAYVGAQGDEWDAQKDMALATLGAVIAMVLAAV
jgi:putative membrane protein